MTTKTRILAATAGLALTAALAGVSATSAFADRYERGGHDGDGDRRGGYGYNLPRVSAVGAAPSQAAARLIAVNTWRDKVASRFGHQYSKWWSARNKDVSCQKFADNDPVWDNYGRRGMKSERHYEKVTRCVVSAIPSRGWGGFGWNSPY